MSTQRKRKNLDVNINVDFEELGRRFATGVFREIAKIALIGFLIVVVISFVRNKFDLGTDDSDRSGSMRSGLEVHTDYRTGCQYLKAGDGGLVLRVDRDGKPITLK